jgi:hypothetical protein
MRTGVSVNLIKVVNKISTAYCSFMRLGAGIALPKCVIELIYICIHVILSHTYSEKLFCNFLLHLSKLIFS